MVIYLWKQMQSKMQILGQKILDSFLIGIYLIVLNFLSQNL